MSQKNSKFIFFAVSFSNIRIPKAKTKKRRYNERFKLEREGIELNDPTVAVLHKLNGAIEKLAYVKERIVLDHINFLSFVDELLSELPDEDIHFKFEIITLIKNNKNEYKYKIR